MNRSRRTDGRRAIATLEFAIVLPALALLMLAGFDMSLWFINKFRLDNAAQTLGDVMTEAQTLPLSAFPASYCSGTSATLNYFAIAYTMANPLAVCGNGGATIISGILNNGTSTKVIWQERTGNAGYSSLFGAPGAAPTLPPGYTVPSGHSIIATELYTSISPWNFSVKLMGGPGGTTLYAYSVFEPRLGQLPTPQ